MSNIKDTSTIINFGDWMRFGDFNVDFVFYFDFLTYIMAFVITSVSALVHLYSVSYMSQDPELLLFISYLNFFTFCMLVLVCSKNFVLMFMGWEGVGLASYMLINFWQTRLSANKAAVKAVVINKIGDVSLMLCMGVLFYSFGSLDYFTIFSLVPHAGDLTISGLPVIDLTCLFILGGACAKSAQLGLHTWLPDAMEGPTPVSALIHAATMVTAGVFLIVRCSPIMEYSETTLTIITFLGATTAFFASTTALCQNDIKRVIAYSTCSQLGYMMMACGLSSYDFAMYHLFNHAFFKALLFLSAGAVIHAIADEQDMRKMGGLMHILPVSFVCTLFGSLSLMGFPFLTGFYSKDGILEIAFSSYSAIGMFAYIMGTISAIFTSIYSTRLIFLTFISKPRGFRAHIMEAHDAPLLMTIPLIALFIGAIIVGYFAYGLFVGPGSYWWGNSIFIHPNHIKSDSEFIPIIFKQLPVILSMMAAFLTFLIYFYSEQFYLMPLNKLKLESKFRNLYFFFNYKWFIDPVYNYFIAKPILTKISTVTFKTIDRGILQTFGPEGLFSIASLIVSYTKQILTGLSTHYLALLSFSPIVLFITYIFDFLYTDDLIIILMTICCFPIIYFFLEDKKIDNRNKH